MRFALTASALMFGAMTALGANAASAETKEMTYSSYLPPRHLMNTYGMAPMFDALEKQGIHFKLLTGGQLFSAQNTLKGIGNRTADAGGPVVTPYTRSDLRHANIVADLMMMARSPLAMSAAAVDMYLANCPECFQDYRRNGTVYLSGYGVGGYSLLCNKVVKSMDDAAGKKMRTTGPLGRWAKALGGTPVNMTTGDMVEAMARGQIDCIVGPVAWLKAYPMADSVKSIYSYNLGSLAGVGLLVMNAKVWDGLSDDDQRKIWAQQPGGVARTVLSGYMGDDGRARKLAKQHDIPIYKAEPALYDMWREFRKSEYARTIEDAKTLGVKEPEKIADAFLKVLEKWDGLIETAGLEKMVEDAGDDEAKLTAATRVYEDLIRKNIYDKVDPTKL
ncbi:MAG: hypothetical protein AB7K86_20940 [Rhodospirillales bacterium]